MKTPLIYQSLCAFVAAAAFARPCFGAADGLDWALSPYAAISENILTVDVPADAPYGMYGATATLDLAPYEGRSLGATVMAEAGPISAAAKPIHGLKFMFHFSNPLSGLDCWPEAYRPATPFARRKLEVSDTLSGGSRSATGTLFLGLQGVTGRIVFDLSTLEIVSGDPFYPQENGDLVCAYTESLAGTAPSAPRRRGVMSPARDMTEDDFRTLADWGATLLRYQMVDGPEPASGEAPDAYLARYRAWLDARLDHLDRVVLPLAVRHGMEVVVDLHAVPGGRIEAREFRMFREKAYADEFVALWRRIAERFHGRGGVYGYDLCNEPDQLSAAMFDYWTLQRLAAGAIRAIDPETPVIVESNNKDAPQAFAYLCPLDLMNVVYQVHMYEPGDFTHQIPKKGQAVSPESAVAYPAEGRDRALLEKSLAPVRAFEKKHGAKTYVGEFSASAWAPGADRYIADCIDLFEEYGWDWTYHAFREWEGWSVEHEPVAFGATPESFRPSSDNPRKRALLAGFARPRAGAADYEALRREALERRRLVLWDDDGCDMTHYPYQRKDLVGQPASVENFESVFLKATEGTVADTICYSGTMGFGYFTVLRTGGFVNTNRFAGANEPWRNAVNEFAAMGVDAMDIATSFARRNGKEIFLSLRFNDNHDSASTPENPNCLFSPFKAENPEIMVGHGRQVKCCGWTAADFAQEKVRDFVRMFVRGYLENYDLDGIEFDFFRHPQLFRTVAMGGQATEEELALMTDLMRDFRAMAEEVGRKRGRPFVLCARVPDSFDYCRAIGIDLDAWLKAGALDFLVVGGYFQLEPWRATAERVHGHGVKCYASIDETRIAGYVEQRGWRCIPGRSDRECWIARIAAAMASGMDGVNLFNIEYFSHGLQKDVMRRDIRDLDGVDKFYFGTYVGGGGYMPDNFLVGGMDYWKTTGVNPAHPTTLDAGATHRFELVVGDDFAAARRKEMEPRIEVQVLTDLPDDVLPVVTVGGRPLEGGTAKDGLATFFPVDESLFAKGANEVAVSVPEATILRDFAMRVRFRVK